jgi:hypothetical protein
MPKNTHMTGWILGLLNMHLSAPAHHNREIWFLVDDRMLEVGADVHTHVRRHDPVTSCFTGS